MTSMLYQISHPDNGVITFIFVFLTFASAMTSFSCAMVRARPLFQQANETTWQLRSELRGGWYFTTFELHHVEISRVSTETISCCVKYGANMGVSAMVYRFLVWCHLLLCRGYKKRGTVLKRLLEKKKRNYTVMLCLVLTRSALNFSRLLVKLLLERKMYLIVFIQRLLTRMGKTMKRLEVNHAVPAGNCIFPLTEIHIRAAGTFLFSWR